MRRIKWAVISSLVVSSTFLGGTVQADTLNSILEVGQAKVAAGQKSQAKIDKLSDETYERLQEYKTVLKQIEDIKVYNAQVEKQIVNQLRGIKDIENSIEQVTSIERQITPLILRMIDALEQFIDLDMPFLKSERDDRIAMLRDNFQRSDISVAEKFRQVLEAYKIEGEYGRKIKSYTDTVNIEGTPREVSILQVGRIALLYQTTDMKITGVWDQENRQWNILPTADYRGAIKKGLRIARQQASPDIISLPIAAPEAAR